MRLAPQEIIEVKNQHPGVEDYRTAAYLIALRKIALRKIARSYLDIGVY